MDTKVLFQLLGAAGGPLGAIPLAIDTALKLKSILSKHGGTDFSAEIRDLQTGAIKDLDETDAMIAAWKKEKGFE